MDDVGEWVFLRFLSKAMLPATSRNVCAATVGCTAVATLARTAVNPLLPLGVPYFTFWIAVDCATVIAGWRAGVATVVLGTIIGWYLWLPHAQFWSENLVVSVVFLVLASLQVLLAELMRTAVFRLEQATRDGEFLVHELAHRLQNQLAVFSSIASSTIRHTDDTQVAFRKLQDRLIALGAALKLATGNNRQAILLGELIALVVKPLVPAEERLQMTGNAIEISADRGQSVALVFHELATNALKYGAWCEESGVVRINWSWTPDALTIIWSEDSACASSPPGKKGFGTRLIEHAIEDAQVDLLVSEHVRVVTIRVPMKRGTNGFTRAYEYAERHHSQMTIQSNNLAEI